MTRRVRRRTKSLKNDSKTTDSLADLPPYLKAYLKIGNMDGYGKDSFPFHWTQLILLIQFSYYFLLNINSNIFNWICLGLSIIAIILLLSIIRSLAKDFISEINPFDFVTQELLTFASLIIHYGIMSFIIYKIDNSQYSFTVEPNLFNFLYNAFATVGTIGFYDLYPATAFTKIIVIIELCISLWFLSTMIPLAISLQSERIKSYTIAKKEFEDELEKAVKEGKVDKVSPSSSLIYEGDALKFLNKYRRINFIKKMFTKRPQ